MVEAKLTIPPEQIPQNLRVQVVLTMTVAECAGMEAGLKKLFERYAPGIRPFEATSISWELRQLLDQLTELRERIVTHVSGISFETPSADVVEQVANPAHAEEPSDEDLEARR